MLWVIGLHSVHCSVEGVRPRGCFFRERLQQQALKDKKSCRQTVDDAVIVSHVAIQIDVFIQLADLIWIEMLSEQILLPIQINLDVIRL